MFDGKKALVFRKTPIRCDSLLQRVSTCSLNVNLASIFSPSKLNTSTLFDRCVV